MLLRRRLGRRSIHSGPWPAASYLEGSFHSLEGVVLTKIRSTRNICLTLLTALLPVGPLTAHASAGAAPTQLITDNFPQALSNYRTGGWQGPFRDGSGGTVTPTSDAIYMDGTTNAMAFGVRQSPQVLDFELTMKFTIVKGLHPSGSHTLPAAVARPNLPNGLLRFRAGEEWPLAGP